MRAKKLLKWRSTLIFLTLIVSGHELPAQVTTVDRADEIRRALQRADYQLAADLADSAIVHFEAFPPEVLAEIHALRGLIASEQNESALVDAHFLAALQLDADHQLDAIFFSPSLQARFEKMRAKLPKREAPVRVETRYVMVADPRLAAAWKSLILPGWGQRFKGEATKGKFFTIASVTLAGAALTSHFLRAAARQDYLDANELTVSNAYRTYNRYHLLRNNLALGLGLVWGAAVLDALVAKPEPQKVAVRLHPAPLCEKKLTLLVTFSF